MKTKSLKIKIVAFALVGLTAFGTIAPAANTVTGTPTRAEAAVNPTKVNEAAGKFIDAVAKFFPDTGKVQGLQLFMSRLGGISAAASGVIGILQMCGVIKDPTAVKLGQILDGIHDIQGQLDQMDIKLDNINEQLVKMAATDIEKKRNNDATTMLGFWRKFKTDYTDPMDDKLNEYEGLINEGIKKWWKQAAKDGVRVNYTVVEEQKLNPGIKFRVPGSELYITKQVPYLTYEKSNYEDGLQKQADNGEAISEEFSFGVPAECLPDTAAMRFDVNTYRDIFEKKMAECFIAAADAEELDAVETFYEEWKKLTDEKKREKAETYATDILNTLIYYISCEVMSENDKWVISVMNAYRKYCNNVTETHSGVDAMLNAMYCTHAFEGEIKDDIDDYVDMMVAKTGFYGEFALTCAGQDEMQSLSNRQKLQDEFTDTILDLSDKKDKAVKGHDNLCYITGTLVEYDTAKVSSRFTLEVNANPGYYYNYKKITSEDWKYEGPNMMDSVYTQVLYHQYQTQKQGCKSFAAYLNKYNTGFPKNAGGTLLTKYGGTRVFALNEGIWMKASQQFGNYFKHGEKYRVNLGNKSDIENQYFQLHDKYMIDTMDMASGTMHLDEMGAARAAYCESHTFWCIDEVHGLYTDNLTCNAQENSDWKQTKNWVKTYDLWKNYQVLKLAPCGELKGAAEDNDPFFAFDEGYIAKCVADVAAILSGLNG